MRENEDGNGDTSVRDEIAALLLPIAFQEELQVDSTGKVITWPDQKRKKSPIHMPSEETDEDDESSFIRQLTGDN